MVAVGLLDSTGHNDTVTVVLRTMGKDSRGARVPVEVGRVLHTGMIQHSTQADVERYAQTGAAVLDMKRFICRDFPGDDISQVITNDGRVWDIAGSVQRHRNSRCTSRDIVMLSAHTPERRW